MTVRRYPYRPGGSGQFDNLDTTGAAVGQVVAVAQVGPLGFEVVNAADLGVATPSAPTPLEILSGSYFYTDGTSFDLVTSADTPAGAVLLLIQAEDYGTLAGMPAPTGTAGTWTQLDTADRGTNLSHMILWTRTVTTAGAQTVTVGQNTVSAGEFYAALYVLPPGSVIEAADAVTGTTAASHLAPSLAAPSASLLICAWINEYEGGAHTYSPPPAGMAERTRNTESGSSAATLLTATEEIDSAGATGTREVAISGTATAYLAASLLVSGPDVAAPLAEWLLRQVPSLEELEGQVHLGGVSDTVTPPVSVANVDQRIAAVSLTVAANVAASDTNYWTIEPTRYRGGTGTVIASRTTQTTGFNAGMADYEPWTFDLAAFGSAQYLQKGDVLALRCTRTGAPDPLVALTVTWRYEPGVTP